MTLQKKSPCKINLLLNILGRRGDGFHELETVMQPVKLFDELTFERAANGIQLTCSDATLPTDARNLVVRAANAFLEATHIREGVRVHLEKRIPMAAGLGGGSGNAATTLLALNELFGAPLSVQTLHSIAATLGSDVNFFLQPHPALATGRGEKIRPLDSFSALRGCAVFLVHPGFGISTPWAYKALATFPSALNGEKGRAEKLIGLLQGDDVKRVGGGFYNSLEAPALEKFPVLALYQEFLRAHGAAATLMSGSGSTTFAIFENMNDATAVTEPFKATFGETCWTAVIPV